MIFDLIEIVLLQKYNLKNRYNDGLNYLLLIRTLLY